MEKIFYGFLFIAVVFAGAAHAGEYRNLSVEEVKAMADSKKPVTLVDARTFDEYNAAHIPGAINLPPERLGEAGALLPKDRKRLMVFYCRGVS